MPSATIASLSADLQTIVKRGDLAADGVLHLKNALLKAHTSDYYLKDIFETNFQFGQAAANYTLDYKQLIPRWRSIKYLEVVDPITLQTTKQLDGIPLEKWIDGYSYLRDYVYYLAGSNIQIRVSGRDTVFGVGCYLYPDTTLVAPSWIADEFPFAILYEAARTLFKVIGYDEQSSSMERLVAEAMAEVKQTGITTTGY
jgi:hypothetical protein